MRLRVGCFLFVLTALLVACGGGGKSGLLPSAAQPGGGASQMPSQATKQMAVVLKIPPASQQSHSRRPFFVSSNTQSIVFAVVPNGSGTPTPAQEQVFPVATPSPCATTGAGGETCTFNVTAPYGTDIFYVATFAVPSPNASSSPLASFVSGAVAIASPAPGVTPSPLAFTMNGIVANVAITIPNPDPNNTPNTQVFLVGVAATPVPLGITPYDASGAAILSDTFLVPVILSVTPAGEGVGMTLNATCAGATSIASPSPVVDVTCASDLANVKFSYGGGITADSNDHVVDTFAITAEQTASPAPSPASVVLASNVQTSTFGTGGPAYNAGYLQTLPNNVIAYMLISTSLTTAAYGTFNVSTGSASTPITLNGTTPSGFYTMSDGSVWVTDRVNDDLLCFTAGSGTATTTVPLSGFMTYASDVTFDGAKIWASGSSLSSPMDVVAYAPLTASCMIGGLASSTLTGDIYPDNDLLMAPQSAGGVLIDGVSDGGAWTVTASGAVTQLNPGFIPDNAFGGGVGIDGTGVGYFSFNTGTAGVIMTLASGGSAFSQTLAVPPVHFAGLAAFGPNGGAADRIGYADTTNQTLGVVEGPNSATPLNILTTLGYTEFAVTGQNVAISTKGAGFVIYFDLTANAVTLARTEFTSTWWIPVTTLPLNNVLSIDERGDSGPFTLTPVGTPPSCLGTISTVPNTDHDFYVPDLSGSSTCVVTLKVTDKNGRSQTVTVTAQPNAG